MKIKGLEKELSPIMIGTATALFPDPTTPWVPQAMTTEESWKILDELWDMGLRAYDCASHYGEFPAAAYLRARNRTKEAVILTKGCHPHFSRSRVTSFDLLSDFYDSLDRMQVDHIDIYLLHRDNPDTPVEEIVPVLDRLHREGLVGIYGGSNWTVERIKEANRFAEENGMMPFLASSPNYGLAHQVNDPWGFGCVTLTGPEHEADRAWYHETQMPVIAYSSLGRGFFSGKFKSSDKAGAEACLDEAARKGYFADENFERLARAEELAEKYCATVAQIAQAWLFAQKDMTIIPVQGGTSAKRFRETLAAKEIPLSEEEVKWLNLEV